MVGRDRRRKEGFEESLDKWNRGGGEGEGKGNIKMPDLPQRHNYRVFFPCYFVIQRLADHSPEFGSTALARIHQGLDP